MEVTRLNNLGWALDALANLDVFGKGIIGPLYKAAMEMQGGPLTLKIAQAIMGRTKPRQAVIIATGFPERAWVASPIAETDGPPGAATLARALYLGVEALPIILIDEPFIPLAKATCNAAGMVPLDFKYFENLQREGGFQAVFVLGVSIDRANTYALCDDLLGRLKPAAVISIERPGQNSKGVYHQVGGHAIPEDAVAAYRV